MFCLYADEKFARAGEKLKAKNFRDFTKKGTHLFVEGRVGCETFKDRETGEARSVITINVTRVQLLDKRAAGSEPVIDSDETEEPDEEATFVYDASYDVQI
ncbi:MAG TPA: single-stranded DNA-binding protein [Pyrinomonadaceae bacterium]|nr:single-stranded DNA-binding protein [Pyrinomonadaceae bacterium]